MRLTRLYTPQSLIAGEQLTLEPQPSRHLVKVLRLREGAETLLFNGSGGEWAATLVAANPKAAGIQVGSLVREEGPPPLIIHLGICVSRGHRMDHIIQKSTELGVTKISPLYSERSGSAPAADRESKKVRHWTAIAISACEQSGRCRLPDLVPATSIDHWVSGRHEDLKMVLHPTANGSIYRSRQPESIAVLIGPEGGFSDKEIITASDSGFASVALGPRILRTETAPIATIAILQHMWGDLNQLHRSS